MCEYECTCEWSMCGQRERIERVWESDWVWEEWIEGERELFGTVNKSMYERGNRTEIITNINEC